MKWAFYVENFKLPMINSLHAIFSIEPFKNGLSIQPEPIVGSSHAQKTSPRPTSFFIFDREQKV